MGLLLGGHVSAPAAPATVWDLAGLASSYSDSGIDTLTYEVAISFDANASLDVFRQQASDLLNEVDPYVTPTAEAANTWVRCTHVSGDDMTSGSARGTWVRLDATKSFIMTKVSAGGTDLFTGVFNFELSSDSSGSPIEATKNSVTITAGETF